MALFALATTGFVFGWESAESLFLSNHFLQSACASSVSNSTGEVSRRYDCQKEEWELFLVFSAGVGGITLGQGLASLFAQPVRFEKLFLGPRLLTSAGGLLHALGSLSIALANGSLWIGLGLFLMSMGSSVIYVGTSTLNNISVRHNSQLATLLLAAYLCGGLIPKFIDLAAPTSTGTRTLFYAYSVVGFLTAALSLVVLPPELVLLRDSALSEDPELGVDHEAGTAGAASATPASPPMSPWRLSSTANDVSPQRSYGTITATSNPESKAAPVLWLKEPAANPLLRPDPAQQARGRGVVVGASDDSSDDDEDGHISGIASPSRTALLADQRYLHFDSPGIRSPEFVLLAVYVGILSSFLCFYLGSITRHLDRLDHNQEETHFTDMFSWVFYSALAAAAALWMWLLPKLYVTQLTYPELGLDIQGRLRARGLAIAMVVVAIATGATAAISLANDLKVQPLAFVTAGFSWLGIWTVPRHYVDLVFTTFDNAWGWLMLSQTPLALLMILMVRLDGMKDKVENVYAFFAVASAVALAIPVWFYCKGRGGFIR